ncbi:MAG TPA: glycosyltransferase [Thermoanaerobaculia bacterium]|nr:glycosyltransferase [Thermoanaerobaculia bacterium]
MVAGMHRSGTSLVASWLAAAGVDLGRRLLAPDASNPTGYFEDLGFLDLDRRMLREATPEGEAGHPDWGWTESERLDRARFAAHADEARALIAAQERSGQGGPWGWKDPRTTLLLDFWDGLLPEARYVLLYRFPWEVADSMQRLGADVFLDHPQYAYRIWACYNRHLLDFYARHRERCLLLSANALLARPEALRERLAGKLGVVLPETSLRTTSGLFSQVGGADPLIALALATHPDCARLLAELDRAADLPGPDLGSAPPLDGRRLAADDHRPVDLSIVIPCHDDGEFLVEAVASAERSAPERAELLIVDDGSTAARTLEVLEVLRRAGYRVIDQENAGLAAARNRGIREARGRYLLPLDADNRLRPGFPAAAVAALDADPAVGVVYGDRQEFGCRSRRVAVPEFDLNGLLRANSIDACSVLRREVWEQCGGYDGTMPAMGWEDWDLWLGAAERGWRFQRLTDVTFDYRVRPASMASGLLTAAVGEPLRLHMIDKHYALYRRRLPSLLTAQHETGLARAELAAAAAERDRLRTERDAILAQRDELGRQLAEAEADLAEAGRERVRLAGERRRLEDERDRLYAELAAYRRRVESMAGTRAWRVREWLLRLRGR